jgi:hypothetical protein
MTRILQTGVGANLVLSLVAVVAMTVYGLATVRPFPQDWMGQTGEMGIPGWVDILVVSPALLLAFLMRRRTEQWRVRLFIGSIGAWGLLMTLMLPHLLPSQPDLFPAPALRADRLVFWYGCLACLVYGLVGARARSTTQNSK